MAQKKLGYSVGNYCNECILRRPYSTFKWLTVYLAFWLTEGIDSPNWQTLMIIPYDRRTLEGDQSIYLPQPNNKFEPTNYEQRVANVLNLDYQGIEDKIIRAETER